MGCGTGCGCGPTYEKTAQDKLYQMNDVLALMKETNMFSGGEISLIEEAVDAYDLMNEEPEPPSTGGGSYKPELKGWAIGYEDVN